jgi:hypothetical protein
MESIKGLIAGQANKANIEKVAHFEAAIKRPYFHVKPLDQAQLSNWWAYLDYKTKSGTHAATVRLFERCLVPCAAYSGTSFEMQPWSVYMSSLTTPKAAADLCWRNLCVLLDSLCC